MGEKSHNAALFILIFNILLIYTYIIFYLREARWCRVLLAWVMLIKSLVIHILLLR